MPGIIRTILLLLVLISGWGFAEKRFHIHKRKARIVVLIVILLIVAASCIYPPEAIFLSFETPESAYDYSYGGDIILTLEGDNSALVVASDGPANYNHEIVPKRDDCWGMCFGFDTETIYGTSPNITIIVYRHKKSNDAYACITGLSEKVDEISDDLGSVFDVVSTNDSYPGYSNYYSYIGPWTEDYQVTVNGTTYHIVSGFAQPIDN